MRVAGGCDTITNSRARNAFTHCDNLARTIRQRNAVWLRRATILPVQNGLIPIIEGCRMDLDENLVTARCRCDFIVQLKAWLLAGRPSDSFHF